MYSTQLKQNLFRFKATRQATRPWLHGSG